MAEPVRVRRCLLRRRGITFQLTKTWKESPDPDRDAKLDRIEQVLDRFPDRVCAFDEFGPLGIRPIAGSCWAKQGKPNRLSATYRRTHGVNRRRKGTTNTLAALKSIRAAPQPDQLRTAAPERRRGKFRRRTAAEGRLRRLTARSPPQRR